MLMQVNWIFAFPAGVIGAICLGVSVVVCVCGCRAKEPKDELEGVEGRVKITQLDEFEEEVNANKISTSVAPELVQKSAKRSLPDLPVDSQASRRRDIHWEPNGDATSELYATVILKDEKNKEHNQGKSEATSVNPLTTYVKGNKDHAYDRLKNVEHPYAQLKDHDRVGLTLDSAPALSSHLKEDRVQDNEDYEVKVVAPVRCGEESSGNIAAATAITGHVSASDDLPYMTPPAHFSGDSQDSGKGYTSISVREPLSAIRGDIDRTRSRRSDPHYATVSDDSDDMYAAIDDPSQVYTSESETYARINNGPSRLKTAPQPPSVDSLKQMTITSSSHSRQASSSSLASSTVVSSPKPEKRPANSPLPPTPTRSPDSVELPFQMGGDNVSRRPGSPKNVEDMYAKVNKKLRREAEHLERGFSTESGVSESSDSLSLKLPCSSSSSSSVTTAAATTTTSDNGRSCHSKSTLTDAASSFPSSAGSSSWNGHIPADSFESETDPQSGYEKLRGSSLDRKSDPGYETVNRGPSSESDPEYEKLRPQGGDGGYARVKEESHRGREEKEEEAEGNGNECRAHGEPTYERLAGEPEDSCDPNYESVRFVANGRCEPPYQMLKDFESGLPRTSR